MKLSQLKAIVDGAISEGRVLSQLREHVVQKLGTTIRTSTTLEELAEAINERLDVIEHGGHKIPQFDVRVIKEFAKVNSVDARKLLARTLPVKDIGKLAVDKDSSVRSAVAERVNENTVKKMIRRFPNDDALREIFKKKRRQRLYEAATKEDADMELSDLWYENTARNLMSDYGNTLDTSWKNLAVRNLCMHTKATSGIVIDQEKLRKKLDEVLTERDDQVLDEGNLGFRSEMDQMEQYVEIIDPVRNLNEEQISNSLFIKKAIELFEVKHAALPPLVRKFAVSEGIRAQSVPTKARVPHTGCINENDEKALDRFCEAWNEQQEINGDPLKLSWHQHPEALEAVSFEVVMK
jgi:hypothetical protein